MKKDDACDHGAQGSDAGPDGVSSAKGQDFGGLGQKHKAEDHADHGEDREFQDSKSFGKFQAGGPEDFQPSGDDKIKPFHIFFSFQMAEKLAGSMHFAKRKSVWTVSSMA